MGVLQVPVPSTSASLVDARLREALKAHDLLAELLRPRHERRQLQTILDDLAQSFSKLEELAEVHEDGSTTTFYETR